jgi:hypothetical protein
MLPHTIIDFTEPRQNLRLHHAREECATENCLKRGVHSMDLRTAGANSSVDALDESAFNLHYS